VLALESPLPFGLSECCFRLAPVASFGAASPSRPLSSDFRFTSLLLSFERKCGAEKMLAWYAAECSLWRQFAGFRARRVLKEGPNEREGDWSSRNYVRCTSSSVESSRAVEIRRRRQGQLLEGISMCMRTGAWSARNQGSISIRSRSCWRQISLSWNRAVVPHCLCLVLIVPHQAPHDVVLRTTTALRR
jgi:hypothetical protein